MATEWENKKGQFDVVDVRELSGNFLPGLLNKAGQIEVGEGMCVVQSFEPIPLYSAMADLGFEHLTERLPTASTACIFAEWKRRKPPLPVSEICR